MMNNQLQHRGPDGAGIHRIDRQDGSGVALGHRRLSIIDLDGGKQPLSNEDGSIWVTFNGEIYNYVELRRQLETAGHVFRTNSDTETLVHLYEQYGDEFVKHLRGMFALAIWDERTRRLVIARDRLGQKPLTYYHDEDRFIFASEVKAILAASDVHRELRSAGVDEYLLYGYVPHPHTMFSRIQKLPPAHLGVFQNGRLTTRRYWCPDLTPDPTLGDAQVQQLLTTSLSEAVRLRLRSDVPLGAFLSGGVDSTVIVGEMQRHATTATQTFTIGFRDAEFDESAYALEAARHLKTNHKRLEVNADSTDLIEKLCWHFDEPFADSSAIPTFYVSQLTREHVKVALTGDGGDELFCGYDRYPTIQGLRRFDQLPRLLKGALTGPWVDWLPVGSDSSLLARLQRRLQVLRRPLGSRYENWLTAFPQTYRNMLYQKDFLATIDCEKSSDFIRSLLESTNRLEPGVRAMRADLLSYLPCDLLAKVDITSMANGLECRSPFLDHEFVEASLRVPYSRLYRPGKVKPCLTSTFAAHLPKRLQSRPKMGFCVPLDRWFREDLKSYAYDTLLSSSSLANTLFERRTIETLFAEQQRGTVDHGRRLWSLLSLELWGSQVLNSVPRESSSESISV